MVNYLLYDCGDSTSMVIGVFACVWLKLVRRKHDYMRFHCCLKRISLSTFYLYT